MLEEQVRPGATSATRLAELLKLVGLAAPPAGEVTFVGQDPLLPCRFPVSESAAGVIAAIGVAVNDLWEPRTGRRQRIGVDVRRAAASLRSARYQRLDGQSVERDPVPDLNFSDLYQCRDGRWVHLHGGFPHLAANTARLLDCGYERESIAAAVGGWDSQALEDALAEIGMCGAIARSATEWAAHPQGQALAAIPPVEVIKIADSAPEPLPPGDRPLTGIRALDLTRVLAGPFSGRTLAEHGADVLTIASPGLPSTPANITETNHGKLSAYLDLNNPAEAERLRDLTAQADIFTQGYRAGALERRGFGPDQLAALRPGLIYVSINCYGPVGPWRGRPGWEQLGQTVTGLAVAQGAPDRPRIMPAQACDYTTGYFAALGILIALGRRAREGGSYHVRASLSQTGMWLERPGPIYDPAEARGVGEVDELCITTESPFGTLRHLRPVIELSETPPHWTRPPVPLGTHAPEWPDKSSVVSHQ